MHVQADVWALHKCTHFLSLRPSFGGESWLTTIKPGLKETCSIAYKQMQKLNLLLVNVDILYEFDFKERSCATLSPCVCDAPESHVWMCDTWLQVARFCQLICHARDTSVFLLPLAENIFIDSMMRDIVSMEYNGSHTLYTHNFLDAPGLYDCFNYPSTSPDSNVCICVSVFMWYCGDPLMLWGGTIPNSLWAPKSRTS